MSCTHFLNTPAGVKYTENSRKNKTKKTFWKQTQCFILTMKAFKWVKETLHKPTCFKLRASEQSFKKSAAFNCFIHWTSQPAEPTRPSLEDSEHLQTSEISAYEKLFCLLKKNAIWCLFFFLYIFMHWKIETLPGRNSSYQSISLAPAPPFRFLWDVKTGFCLTSQELRGDRTAPAALNRCSEEDRDS